METYIATFLLGCSVRMVLWFCRLLRLVFVLNTMLTCFDFTFFFCSHSEIDSFLWFLEQLIQLEKEINADRQTGTIRNIHIFEANIYITRAPKPKICTDNPQPIPPRVYDLLTAFKTTARSKSVTRGLAPTPVHHHMQVDIGEHGSVKRSGGMGGKKNSGVAQAGLSQRVDIGYEIENLYGAMYNPTVSSKEQTNAQLPMNVDMAENRLGGYLLFCLPFCFCFWWM